MSADRTWVTGNSPHHLPATATVIGEPLTPDDPIVLGGIYDHDVSKRADWPEFVQYVADTYGIVMEAPDA